MGFTRRALGSRFGVRILVAFIGSAVIPMLILSALSYNSTRDQLEEDALVSLRRDAKSASMSIVERINIGAAQLELVAWHAQEPSHESVTAFSRVIRTALTELDLTAAQRQHLGQGRSLLLGYNSESNALQLVRSTGDEVLVGSFDAKFLYGPDRIGDGERYWVTDHQDRYLFGSDSDGHTREIVEQIPSRVTRRSFDIAAASGPELAVVWPLFLKNPFLSPELRIGLSRSIQSIHRPLREFRRSFATALILGLLGSISIALHQIRIRVSPLESLVAMTRDIEKGELSARSAIASQDEFELLGSSINAMAEKLERDFRNLETLRSVADSLLATVDIESTAAEIIPAALVLSGASRGEIFLVARKKEGNRQELLEIEGLKSDTSSSLESDSSRMKFAEDVLDSLTPRLILREDEPGASTWVALDRTLGKRAEAAFVAPLISGSGRPEGIIQLVFRRAPRLDQFSDLMSQPLVILAAQAGAALKNVTLIEDLRGLFEGVVRLTVNAIDEKSPYTGDHCRRVPVLAELITDAVCNDRQGPLKDFSLTEDERYELKIAALLHDCGKVATPVHIMDKATKLETIHDRVEIVQARAEILRRDFELASLRADLQGDDADPMHRQPWADALSTLDEDLAVVERCNIGAESMEEGLRLRIDQIETRYGWVDRNGRDRPLITKEESRNLKIGRGTLNDDEREMINAHVVTTIKLLNQLPFPPEMKNVPAIAGAHHEHVDGTGYPNGLGHAELSTQSRILGLADVFEALTAKTRPYKPGKTLSETLEILQHMVDNGKIDRDIYEVFLSSRVYLRYAAEYMDPDQIDEPYRTELEALTAPWTSFESPAPLGDQPLS